MQKLRLFRRGRLAGLVTPSFYQPELKQSVWEKIDLPEI